MRTASEIAGRVRSGLDSPATAVEAALARIEALDGRVLAWAHVDSDGAREQARRLAEPGALDLAKASLLGVPVGIKDIYDVSGLPTGFGAARAASYVAAEDAAAVARLRAAGAVIVGKTATTEFAYMDPAATRNPWNLAHTPGGSSSGSAAAVAAGMLPLALGTQTVGSVLRPAAYCGIVGLKPTHGLIDAGGVFPLAPSFDHVGVLCRGVADAALGFAALTGLRLDFDVPFERPLRFGLARSFYEGVADDEVARHLDDVATRLAGAGAEVREIEMPATAREVVDLGQPVLRAEAAAVHAGRFADHADEYRENLRALVESGFKTSAIDYMSALEACGYLTRAITEQLESLDAILLPAAPTTAPAGLSSTGNSIFCAPASFAGLPSIALPSGLGERGLPLSVQLIAPAYREAGMLRVAAWVEGILNFRARPGLES